MAQGDGRDPFGTGDDRTVLRPGGATSPPAESARPIAAGPPLAAAGAPQPAAAPALLDEFLSRGRNPLVGAAVPLLMLGVRLRGVAQSPDVESVRRQAMQEVRAFEERARAGGVAEDQMRIGRYVLCTFVDLAVFGTPWGGQSHWAAQSLLSVFEREAFGGEKFFQILEKALDDAPRYQDLIELQYLCLALGFESGTGSGRIDDGKRRDLEARACALLRPPSRGGVTELSPHWQGVSDVRNPVRDLLPVWIVALAGLVLVVGAFLFWRAQLGTEVGPIKAALAAQPASDVGVLTTPMVVPSRLKELLARDQQAGRLAVEEAAGFARVTLSGEGLFRSGSATLDPRFDEVVNAVADAARPLGGRLVVVGHTDDLPIRSLRFQDNFELSRARALAVAELLRARSGTAVHVESQGVGDTQPRYQPASTPENRERNRRVEILHFPDRSGP